MENKTLRYLKYFFSHSSKTFWLLPTTLLTISILLIISLYLLNKDNSITISQNKNIEITPTQIRSIEDIGEWEFLAISDEELVDTLRKGFFGDSELVRIYYGTLRLGINLREAQPGWIRAGQDTIVATLPPIKLLDKDFIDEAKTRSFYESGSWNEQAREQLYQKAYNAMLRRCMTPSNIKSAQENAGRQFYHLLTSMGYDHVKIRFQNR
ncbi:DUF4230 domain-containing protein [Prevotella sp. A2931]|uniref:DUF4230 domain-containing protein n=1 Tax=Prevotella illustrans TaxID=2800387 RepID=A0ABS3M5Y7_9BACT|nr:MULTISPECIES: DUF4230 domain-containing protein [Prevotella]MBO1363531.1 DUF4230 domain-containing protein [Prevotella illustrans]PTL26000.1 DUF4230 domain-containing protein [Prevotella sp. oral taxon 820]